MLPAVANRLTATVTSAFKPLASRGGHVASGAVRPPSTPLQSIRPSSGAKPAASGGGSKPMSLCAVNSFVPGMSVLMADGAKKPIEKITLGDLVLATDPETGKSAARPVVAAITGTGEKDLVTVTVTETDRASGRVTATAGHPFWVPDTQEWVDAGDLRSGMWVQTSSGTWVQVTAVEYDHREQTVYNLTIDTTHTYSVYAGDTDVLTHNCGNTAAGSGPVSGVLSASTSSRSLAALRNYQPKGGGVEYVFDPATNTFAAGRPAAGAGLQGSPHQQLAQSIGADTDTVVGGTFTRGSDGAFITTENSGHFWQNWNPEIRQQFQEVMTGYGFEVR